MRKTPLSSNPAPLPRWVYELGDDLDTLREVEATARREARYKFVCQQPQAGRRRMWEATQIQRRIAALGSLPKAAPAAPPTPAQPDLEVAAQQRRLAALGIYPTNAERLSVLPPLTIDRAVVLAQSIAGDTAALVVAFLDRHQTEGWAIPTPPQTSYQLLDLSRYEAGGVYGDVFARDQGTVITSTDGVPEQSASPPSPLAATHRPRARQAPSAFARRGLCRLQAHRLTRRPMADRHTPQTRMR